MTLPDSLARFDKLVGDFIDDARRELEQRWANWFIDLAEGEIYEVIGALLARQVTLARSMAESPGTWTGHVAPLVLRAMADVYISLAWVLEKPLERSQRFIEYGLGQEKLQLGHREAQVADREPTPEEQILIDSSEEWINSQRFEFLTEVDLGSWSGKSSREMAEEAGCLNFYNRVYSPFSACTHSMWHHVERYNLKQCMNPLHRYHRVPDDPQVPLDPYYLYLSANYLEETFSLFDAKLGVRVDSPSAFERLCEALENLSNQDGDEPIA